MAQLLLVLLPKYILYQLLLSISTMTVLDPAAIISCLEHKDI